LCQLRYDGLGCLCVGYLCAGLGGGSCSEQIARVQQEQAESDPNKIDEYPLFHRLFLSLF